MTSQSITLISLPFVCVVTAIWFVDVVLFCKGREKEENSYIFYNPILQLHGFVVMQFAIQIKCVFEMLRIFTETIFS